MLIYCIKAYILPIKKNTEALLVDRKEIFLEVNGETTKCMFMFREHYSGKNHNIKIDHKAFESVENFPMFRNIPTNKFGIHKEIKYVLNSVNAC